MDVSHPRSLLLLSPLLLFHNFITAQVINHRY